MTKIFTTSQTQMISQGYRNSALSNQSITQFQVTLNSGEDFFILRHDNVVPVSLMIPAGILSTSLQVAPLNDLSMDYSPILSADGSGNLYQPTISGNKTLALDYQSLLGSRVTKFIFSDAEVEDLTFLVNCIPVVNV